MVQMSTLTFDQFFEAAVAISSTLMVLSGAWIVRVLIQIEKSKAIALSSVLEDDGTSGDLQFEESTASKQLEVEPADAGAIEMSPTKTRRDSEDEDESHPPVDAKPIKAKTARRKQRRVSASFVYMQIASVLVLTLLTYLLLVVSNAAVPLRILGSLCVFGVFLRFQIGEEVRRQRVDRIMLLLSLFLFIASMLSTLVYSFKTLSQGEIYEGPARIVGYDMEQYNNTKHDPTKRTDIAVSWGRDWGCPMSGGKVCQANIQGAMCQTHPAKEQTKHKPHYENNRRKMQEDKEEEKQEQDNEEAEEIEEELEEDLEEEEDSNQELEYENEALEKENQELEQEIEELKEENALQDEEMDSLVDEENSELNEIADEYDEDIMYVEEEMYDESQQYEDALYEEDEEKIEEEIEDATDDAAKEDLTEQLEDLEEDQNEIDSEYEEDEEILDEYADEYANAADEDYSDFVAEEETTYELEDEVEEVEGEVEQTEAEINAEGGSSGDDVYEEMAEEIYEEEEEEIEEEYEEELYEEEEEWYWDEYPDSYDDDHYQDEYWSYDWDSVWGDYACEDLFDNDISGKTFDPNSPAGGDDEWPFVYIYGSCKTCEAYILDYFAEEAFEETQEYKQQAIVYLAGALAGFIWSMLSYIKYRVLPTAENEISLMGSDGGVMA